MVKCSSIFSYPKGFLTYKRNESIIDFVVVVNLNMVYFSALNFALDIMNILDISHEQAIVDIKC